MLGYAWPGNVRELQNAIERACMLAMGPKIQVGDLPEHLREQADSALIESTLQQARKAVERKYLEALLQEQLGNVSRAAARAGMYRSSFQRLLKTHALQAETYRHEG